MSHDGFKPTPAEIASIAASLRLSEGDDLGTLVRTAVQLYHLSESKLGELAKFQREIGAKVEDWLAIDADDDKRRAWLAGEKPVTSAINSEIGRRAKLGEEESKKLGAQGPPEKRPFSLNDVADKILPQTNPTERLQAAQRFLAKEIETVGSATPLGEWLEKNKERKIQEKQAWWVIVEILVRHQRQAGRFRKGNRWEESLRARRKESQPPGRWEEFR